MISVNLLPVDSKENITNKRLKNIFNLVIYVASISFAVVGVLLFIFTQFIQKSRIESLRGETQDALVSIRSEKDLDKILTVQNQLSALPVLHNAKPIPSRMFGYLEKVTPENVTLTNVTVDFQGGSEPSSGPVGAGAASALNGEGGNKVVISGITDNYKSFNVFIEILRNAEFKTKSNGSLENGEDIQVTGKQLAFMAVREDSSSLQSSEALSFTVSFGYEPTLFSFEVDDVDFTVPSKVTTISESENLSGDDRSQGLFVEDPFKEDEEGQGDN